MRAWRIVRPFLEVLALVLAVVLAFWGVIELAAWFWLAYSQWPAVKLATAMFVLGIALITIGEQFGEMRAESRERIR